VTIGVLVLAGSAVAAVISTSDDNPAVRAIKNAPSVSGPHRLVQSFGIDPSSASSPFKTALGETSIAENQEVACLLRGTNEDQCYVKSNIAAGRGFSIQVDCSVGSDRRMIIEGFVPGGAAAVQVAYSDGSTPMNAKAAHGAYVMVGRTPDEGAAYPTRLNYLDAAGNSVAVQEIVGGSDLCMSKRR
jgi:hypothetical protein